MMMVSAVEDGSSQDHDVPETTTTAEDSMLLVANVVGRDNVSAETFDVDPQVDESEVETRSVYAVNRALQFLMLHFVVLCTFQAAAQLATLVLALGRMTDVMHISDNDELMVFTCDSFLVVLFFIEVATQLAVSGCTRFMKSLPNVVDFTICAGSVAIIAFEFVFVEHRDDAPVEPAIELARTTLRMGRLLAFSKRLHELLKLPISEFSQQATRLNVAAKGAIWHIKSPHNGRNSGVPASVQKE